MRTVTAGWLGESADEALWIAPRWSNSHTLTGASGPQLLREWTEQLADARSAQGQHRGLRPLDGSLSAAHTAQSADLDITPRCFHVLPPSSSQWG